MKKNKKQKHLYELSLTCEYEEKKETHTLHIGSRNQCFGIMQLSKLKEKQFIKSGKIPKEAKLTYTIKLMEELKNE